MAIRELAVREMTLDLQDYPPGGTVFKRTAVRGIAQRDGKYLIIHSKYGDCKFPGGGREPGERLQDTLCREVREETGYEVIPESIGDCILVHERRKGKWDDLLEQDSWYYFCEVSGERGQRCLDEYEKEFDYQVEWLSPGEILERNRAAVSREKLPWVMREVAVLEEMIGKGI